MSGEFLLHAPEFELFVGLLKAVSLFGCLQNIDVLSCMAMFGRCLNAEAMGDDNIMSLHIKC
jgi:hypothetical protein